MSYPYEYCNSRALTRDADKGIYNYLYTWYTRMLRSCYASVMGACSKPIKPLLMLNSNA